ncbi:hypothetical protein [Hyalangium sp.]|uniref:hypothetical protein n=1 Tax=Hyalangium sp. TaxID=2028555 RepID=UPI002D3D90EB|nr:hypothetical protein [Hyalangium sp.]HYI01965.1 hypothetical protein [Hyalangium sp.]
MKKSSRSFLLLSLMALVMMTSRCDCGSGTSSGRCEGAIGGLLISDEITAESAYSIDHDQGRNIIRASFGGQKVQIEATVSRATVLTGGDVLNLPSELPLGGGTGGADGGMGGTDGGTVVIKPASPEIKSWELRTQEPRPRLREGTLERVLTFVDLRLSTTLRLIFEDGTSLICEFQLRHDEEQDVGRDPSDSEGGGCLSGGGGGGDSDFD